MNEKLHELDKEKDNFYSIIESAKDILKDNDWWVVNEWYKLSNDYGIDNINYRNILEEHEQLERTRNGSWKGLYEQNWMYYC